MSFSHPDSDSLDLAVAWLRERIAGDATMRPELFAHLQREQQARGLVHGTRPICSSLVPYLMSRARYAEIGRAAETLAFAFERVAQAALEDDAVMRLLGVTEMEAKMARINPGYERLCVTSRLDAYLADDGFKFLEYNAESPAGLADQKLLAEIFFTLPYMREFFSEFPHFLPQPHVRLLDALVAAYKDWGGSEERPCIGIIDWRGVSTESEFHVLAAYFESQGFASFILDPDELEYDGGRLTAGKRAIDILYKRVIIHEFLAKYDDTHPLVRAYRDGCVCMVNSFRTKLVHKKASFAVLSDERFAHLFTDEQRDVIERHIPWTRVLQTGDTTFGNEKCDLVELITKEQARFVIKPNDDYGGEGVCLGGEVSPDEWKQKIAAGLGDLFVVQERAPVSHVRLPLFTADLQSIEETSLTIDFDPFLFNNRTEGGMVRLTTGTLSNVSAGANVAALVIVDNG